MIESYPGLDPYSPYSQSHLCDHLFYGTINHNVLWWFCNQQEVQSQLLYACAAQHTHEQQKMHVLMWIILHYLSHFFPISGSLHQVVGQVSLSLPVMFILTYWNYLTSTTNCLYSLFPIHKLTAMFCLWQWHFPKMLLKCSFSILTIYHLGFGNGTRSNKTHTATIKLTKSQQLFNKVPSHVVTWWTCANSSVLPVAVAHIISLAVNCLTLGTAGQMIKTTVSTIQLDRNVNIELDCLLKQ